MTAPPHYLSLSLSLSMREREKYADTLKVIDTENGIGPTLL